MSEPIEKMLAELGITAAIRVVKNAIDTRVFCEHPHADTDPCGRWELPGGRFLLHAGRLAADKPVGLLIRAFEQVSAPDVALVIAGSGPDEKALRKQAASCAKADRIFFLGWVDRYQDLPGLYRKACGVVVPSAAESFSLAAHEALACGTPVVLARGGALVALERHIPEALWFRPGSAASLTAALNAVLTDQHLCEEAVGAGRELARAHSLDDMIDQYMAVINEATRKEERRPAN